MVSCTDLAFLCCICLVTTVVGDLPEGHIFQVTPKCGSNAMEDAKINVITDLDANIIAECDGRKVPFTTRDGVHFDLRVGYPTRSSRVCVFKWQQDALVFSVRLLVEFGRGSEDTQMEEYTVTCSFNPSSNSSNSSSYTQHEIEGLIDGKGADEPTRGNLTFNLDLVDVLGRPMSGFVRIGRVVKMKGRISINESNEFGIRPVSCDAVEESARYPVLRDGCGDGVVFSKYKGFTTTDKYTTTPFFGAFRLKDNVARKIECQYRVCKNFCYGSSCKYEKDSITS